MRAVPGIVADGLGTSLMTRFSTGPNSEISIALIVEDIFEIDTRWSLIGRIAFE
jgi:hypothetical protein